MRHYRRWCYWRVGYAWMTCKCRASKIRRLQVKWQPLASWLQIWPRLAMTRQCDATRSGRIRLRTQGDEVMLEVSWMMRMTQGWWWIRRPRCPSVARTICEVLCIIVCVEAMLLRSYCVLETLPRKIKMRLPCSHHAPVNVHPRHVTAPTESREYFSHLTDSNQN